MKGVGQLFPEGLLIMRRLASKAQTFLRIWFTFLNRASQKEAFPRILVLDTIALFCFNVRPSLMTRFDYFAVLPVYMLSLERLFIGVSSISMLDICLVFFLLLSSLLFADSGSNAKLLLCWAAMENVDLSIW